MSDKTGIQWTDATWNPIRGCSRVSEGCRNCYAETVATRFSGPGQAYEGLARRTSTGEARWTGKIMFVERHLEDPLRWRTPKRIFVNSMSDLFHEGVTDEQLGRIFTVMAKADRHTFQILTKRPERMLNWFMKQSLVTTSEELFTAAAGRWPLPNVWLGVSVENQKTACERIPVLLNIPAAVRFLSCEPLIAPVDLIPWLYEEIEGTTMPDFSSPRPPSRGLSWVIVGGESGAGARMFDLEWARDILRDCVNAGVSPFIKQLGAVPFTRRSEVFGRGRREDGLAGGWYHDLRDGHGGEMEEWPLDLRIREFPSSTLLPVPAA